VRNGREAHPQDDVKLLVGAVSSGATLAMMDVTKKHKTIHWNSVSCAGSCGHEIPQVHISRTSPTPACRPTGSPVHRRQDGQEVYIFYTDYAMGQSDGRQFKTALEKLGGEVVGVAGAAARNEGLQPLVRRHQPVEPRRVFAAFAGPTRSGDDPAPFLREMTKKYRMAGIDCFFLQQDLPSSAEPMEGFCAS